MAVRYHYRVYQDWRSVNQVVRVLGLADSVRQLIAPPGPSSPRPSSYSRNRETLGSLSETVLTPMVLQNASRYLPSHIMRNLLSPRPSPAAPGLATETTRSQTSDLCPMSSVSDTVLLLPLNRSLSCVRETYVWIVRMISQVLIKTVIRLYRMQNSPRPFGLAFKNPQL